MGFDLEYRALSGNGLDAAFPLPPEVSSQVLGAQLLSMASQPVSAEFPVQQVCLPRLGNVAAATGTGTDTTWGAELWLSDSERNGGCQRGVVGAIRYSCDGQLLYGTLEIRTADLPADSADNVDNAGRALQQATDDAYAQIFTLLDAQAYPHLWRVWNYIADINDESAGLELYRQFNIGRHQAFEAHGRLHRESVPAACALGMRDKEVALSIAFLAAKQPSLPIENPRQMAAYEYPSEYGPRSPTFARAALAQLPGQTVLFISGTASIVGHASMHVGDAIGQARETVTNIQSLLDEATRIERRADRPWSFQDLNCRVYLRRAADYSAVQALLAEILGADTHSRIEFVLADVCRTELLLEIEAVGLRPAVGALSRNTHADIS